MRMSIAALRLGCRSERPLMNVDGGLRRAWIGCVVVLMLFPATPKKWISGRCSLNSRNNPEA